MNKDFQAGLMMGLLIAQNQHMQSLIDAQHEIIKLHKQVQAMTPPQPEPEEIFFHLQGEHIGSHEAATSDDLKKVLAYREWVFKFTRDYVRPYVNQRVYQEVSTHMLRGVAEQLGKLDTLEREAKMRTVRIVGSKRPPAGVN